MDKQLTFEEILTKLELSEDEKNNIHNLSDKEDKTELVNTLQEICNKAYDKQGLTDVILDLQVYINTLRAEHDITDASEMINKGYVQ